MLVAAGESVGVADTFLHVWPVHVPSNGVGREFAVEIELIGSHTSDPGHLDPSCPACRRLRSELLSIAQTAIRRISAITSATEFEIYADPACIVCSPHDGQRPSVTVSIYVRNSFASSAQNGFFIAVSQLKQALTALGIRER